MRGLPAHGSSAVARNTNEKRPAICHTKIKALMFCVCCPRGYGCSTYPSHILCMSANFLTATAVGKKRTHSCKGLGTCLVYRTAQGYISCCNAVYQHPWVTHSPSTTARTHSSPNLASPVVVPTRRNRNRHSRWAGRQNRGGEVSRCLPTMETRIPASLILAK